MVLRGVEEQKEHDAEDGLLQEVIRCDEVEDCYQELKEDYHSCYLHVGLGRFSEWYFCSSKAHLLLLTLCNPKVNEFID